MTPTGHYHRYQWIYFGLRLNNISAFKEIILCIIYVIHSLWVSKDLCKDCFVKNFFWNPAWNLKLFTTKSLLLKQNESAI
jgi:hypothetical protein